MGRKKERKRGGGGKVEEGWGKEQSESEREGGGKVGMRKTGDGEMGGKEVKGVGGEEMVG